MKVFHCRLAEISHVHTHNLQACMGTGITIQTTTHGPDWTYIPVPTLSISFVLAIDPIDPEGSDRSQKFTSCSTISVRWANQFSDH
jgi:hypothetical protein